MNAQEILEKNELVVTVDGELRFEKDCIVKATYELDDNGNYRKRYDYYDSHVYVADVDDYIYTIDEISETHFKFDDEWYHANIYGICEKCGQVYRLSELHNTEDTDEFVCDECGYCCDECGEWFSSGDSLYYIESEDIYVCQHCFDRDFTTCDRCGDYVRIVDTTYINDNDICNSCREEYYRYCDRCNNYVYIDDYNYDEDCCNDCTTSIDGSFHFISYSAKPDPVFYFTDKRLKYETSTSMGVGFELEITTKEGNRTDCGNSIAEIVGENCYYKEDCSCNNGDYNDEIEIIGHPMQHDYFMNKFPWEDMCKTAVEHNYVSHDYCPNDSSCGFHLHFSRSYFGDTTDERNSTYAKLLMFFDWCWTDLVKASRRKDVQLHWCKKNLTRGFKDEESFEESVEEFYNRCLSHGTEDKYRPHSARYVAINFTNSNTVEIRLCRGSLNANSLKAWADLMFIVIQNYRTLKVEDLYTDKNKFLDGIAESTREYLNSKYAF